MNIPIRDNSVLLLPETQIQFPCKCTHSKNQLQFLTHHFARYIVANILLLKSRYLYDLAHFSNFPCYENLKNVLEESILSESVIHSLLKQELQGVQYR